MGEAARKPNTMKARGACSKYLLAGLVAIAPVHLTVASTANGDAAAETILASALSLRTLAIVRPEVAHDRFLRDFPIFGTNDAAGQGQLLLRHFFVSSIVVLGRTHSPEPIVLFYNPLADVSLVVTWKKVGSRRYTPTSVELAPGETLFTSGEAPLVPDWAAGSRGIQDLEANTRVRLETFRTAHPMLSEVAVSHPRESHNAVNAATAELRLLDQVRSLAALQDEALVTAIDKFQRTLVVDTSVQQESKNLTTVSLPALYILTVITTADTGRIAVICRPSSARMLTFIRFKREAGSYALAGVQHATF